jgi:hypothetical protein
MTNLDDFDRSLSIFLNDGPNNAPEAPVIAALAHARTSPRRPDPLARFRADVMAPRRTGFALRPGLVMAVLAVAVATVGVAVVGSRPSDTNLPGPSGSPASTPNPTAGPSVEPSVGPSVGPTDPAPIHLELTGQCCGTPSIDIVDRSGHLTGAASVAGDNVESDQTTATNDDPRTVRLIWVGAPCDTVHRLTIGPDFGLTIDRPLCHGDSMATFRGVTLTFDQAVDAGSLETAIFDGRPGSGLPTWTATAPDSESGQYDLTVFDPGQAVESIEGSYDPEITPAGAGPTGIRIEQRDATTFRLIWLGKACATAPSLSIDPSGDRWQLANAPCSSAAADVLRMIDVVLASPRTADAIPVIEAVESVP